MIFKKRHTPLPEKPPPLYTEEELAALVFLLRGDEQLAVRLLKRHGSLSGALNDLSIDLLDPQTQAVLRIVRDLGSSRRKSAQSRRHIRVERSDEAGAFFLQWFRGALKEEFAALYMSENYRVIECLTEAVGDENRVAVDVRQLLRRALRCGAKKIIIAHNHPQTVALPSMPDMYGTTLIGWCLRSLGLQLVDHIVVYQNDFISLRESGLVSFDTRVSHAKFAATRDGLEARLGHVGVLHF